MLEGVLRRDRVVVATALAVITLLAWADLIWLAGQPGMAMPGMDMAAMEMAGVAPGPWDAVAVVFAMWAVMMVGMMTPSAAPMILIYARVGRQAAANAKPFAATGWFVAGYLLVWTGFALLAAAGQAALQQAALLDATMAATSQVAGGVILIAAGIYQWTPWKDACLAHCQSPLAFIMRHGGFRADPGGALSLGLRHGAYCVGCCWILMALLFVVGVMDLLWIALISAFVLLEKILPVGRLMSRAAGLVLIAAGIWQAVA